MCVWIWIYYICIVIQFICVPPVPMTIFEHYTKSFNGNDNGISNGNNSSKYVYFIVLYSALNTICLWSRNISMHDTMCERQCAYEYEYDKYISMFWRSLVCVHFRTLITLWHRLFLFLIIYTHHTHTHNTQNTWKCFWWINFIIHVRAKHIPLRIHIHLITQT